MPNRDLRASIDALQDDVLSAAVDQQADDGHIPVTVTAQRQTTAALLLVARAILDSAPGPAETLEPAEVRGSRDVTPAGLLALAVLVAGVVACVWLVTR